jgi:uroporphyrinogen-III synthase
MSGLRGKRILVTRALPQAPALAKLLEAHGAIPILIPTIEIVPPQSFQPLDKALAKVHSYDWLVLTSVNGVQALRKRMEKLDVDPGLLRRLELCAIGPATRAEIESRLGLQVAVMPEEYVAEAVVAALKGKISGKKVLLVRAKVARDVIPRELRAAGAEVDVAEAYQTIIPVNSAAKLKASLEGAERPHAVTFTSSSTAKNFVSLLPKNASPKELLPGTKLASMGPVTSTTLREVGLWVDAEAREYTMEGLVVALETLFAN